MKNLSLVKVISKDTKIKYEDDYLQEKKFRHKGCLNQLFFAPYFNWFYHAVYLPYRFNHSNKLRKGHNIYNK